MRKYEAIDLMKLKSLGSHVGWNKMLTEAYEKRDINRLAKLRYQIQAGMDDLAKNKLNTADMNIWFCRIMKSLEITAKRIIKAKYPLPQDNPLIAKRAEYLNFGEAKKRRDLELKAFLQKSSY